MYHKIDIVICQKEFCLLIYTYISNMFLYYHIFKYIPRVRNKTNFTNIDMKQHERLTQKLNIQYTRIFGQKWILTSIRMEHLERNGYHLASNICADMTPLHLAVCQHGRSRRDSYIAYDKLPCQAQTDNSCSTPPG